MTVDLNTLQKTLVYDVEASVQQILTDLRQVAELDRTIEQKQKLFTTWMTVCIIASVALFLLAVFTETVFLLVLMGVPLVGAIVTGIIQQRYRRTNIPNHRYQLLPKILQMVSRDLNRQIPLKLHLGLSQVVRMEKRTYSGSHPYRGKGWTLERFEDEWLRLEGTFLDNTQFLLTCTELWSRQSGWKRNARGKNKRKVKSKPKGFSLDLTLLVPRKKYGAVTVLEQDAEGAIHLPSHCELKRLKVSDNRLYLMVKTTVHANVQDASDQIYQTITQMFLSLYQILNLAHTLSKSAK